LTKFSPKRDKRKLPSKLKMTRRQANRFLLTTSR
jgi:hypothetical protein